MIAAFVAGGQPGRPQAHRARSPDPRGKGAHGGNRLFPPCSNICRCTGYVNIVKAIKAASGQAVE